ncbi:unnamed protein product [Rhizoctonia solani]|uniref:F-box domain-containing protein n=3 Tax=Rhizoctonia solani TaxID=456999 RepID=A0A8H3A7P9_9AGAM|nr:hypothetical protein RSOL_321110 [Rhizoctonia solani AG-3 Rhs1AP]KEP51808.1 hypothetical protein V565_055560 [Rhizoctonia solani 123E]CAE6397280.1 unnamed protein product [Rhizoctonia solani]CAE6403731.1 unnamed protein product [Rhizoctonia solani]
MARRTSARLAKAKAKKVKLDKEDIYDDLEHDANFELTESEQEEEQPPPRKRQRTATKSPKRTPRKKQVRGKQGLLADLVNMPIDIFTEIASHLLPGDIINLARSNKFFRNLLMHRSAMHIWHGAMKNVKRLPACPEGMSEPYYLSLLFSKTCSMCGGAVRGEMDPMLLVRLCGPCRNANLTPLYPPSEFMNLLPYSHSIAPTKRRLASAYVLRADFQTLMDEWKERKLSVNKSALDAWIEEREEMVDKRREQAGVLAEFLGYREFERKVELVDIKAARRSEIKRRLTELGWTNEDMDISWGSVNRCIWDDLISQPKPLTDRSWTNILPKLTSILGANREGRLNAERDARQRARRARLLELVLGIKSKHYPALGFKVLYPVPSASLPTVNVSHQPPFPDLDSTLEWSIVKRLHETDATMPEMEANFEEHREEIEALIADWATRAQEHFVKLLGGGPEVQGDILRPTTIVCDDGSDPFFNFSDDLKRLLRADSLFYKTTTPSSIRQPLTYSAVFSDEGFAGSRMHPLLWTKSFRPSLDLDKFCLYREAQDVARALLADMAKPDASYLEMKGVGPNFVCGRCHVTDYLTWEQLIQHYLQQNQLCDAIQKTLSSLSDPGIIYNNVHDLVLDTDQPMVKYFSLGDSDDDTNDWSSRPQVCKLCEKLPGMREVSAFKPTMLRHLRDVHEITTPKVDKHYATKKMTRSDLFDMIHFDSDDSGNSDLSHWGCGCEYDTMFDDGELEYGHYDDDVDPGDVFDYDDDIPEYLFDSDEAENDWW